MNVYGKKDESYEESRYPDWTLPEKKETLLPLFSILIGSFDCNSDFCCPTFYF